MNWKIVCGKTPPVSHTRCGWASQGTLVVGGDATLPGIMLISYDGMVDDAWLMEQATTMTGVDSVSILPPRPPSATPPVSTRPRCSLGVSWEEAVSYERGSPVPLETLIPEL